MTRADHDAIVVGAGLGGLSAAGFLARAGARVLVLERGDGPGGYARTLDRGPYRFDLASGIAAGAERELEDRILAHLGARGRCELLPVPELYAADAGGVRVRVPAGLDAAIAAYRAALPGAGDALERFFRLCAEILESTHRLPLGLSLATLDDAAARFPALFRYRSSTLQEVLDELVGDADASAAAAAVWPYVGVPPRRQAFVSFAQGWAVLANGFFACRGGLGTLAEALAAAVGDAGGEIRYRTAASRVAAGTVETADGRAGADVVVVACDPRALVADVPPAYARKLERLRPSSAATVHLVATTLDLAAAGAAHDNVLHDEQPPLWVTVPTLVDATLAPAGEHVLVARVFAPIPTERVLARLDARFRGLRATLTYHEELRDVGPAFGWEDAVASVGSRRPAPVTPIPGVYLAGHWTQPGSGLYRAVLSGMHTARAVLAAAGRPDGVPEFRAVRLDAPRHT